MQSLTDRAIVYRAAAVGGRVNAAAVATMLPMRHEAARFYLARGLNQAHLLIGAEVPRADVTALVRARRWDDLHNSERASEKRRQLDYLRMWAGEPMRPDSEIGADEQHLRKVLGARGYPSVSVDLDLASRLAESDLRSRCSRAEYILPDAWGAYAASFTTEPGIEDRLMPLSYHDELRAPTDRRYRWPGGAEGT